MSKPAIAPIGTAFRIVALLEALTWVGLLIGLWLKYGSQTTDSGVWLFGRLHGLAFLAYLVVTLLAWGKLRWPLWAVLLAIFAAIPPLVTVPVEILFRRRGLLRAPE